MDILDAAYIAVSGLAGAVGRGLRRGLPQAVSVRLDAKAPPDPAPGWVWLHAVSVGELMLAAGLLGRLRDSGSRVHVTTGTPAGLGLLESRLPAWDTGTGRVTGGGFPFDDLAGLSGFLQTPPGAFVALETEIWPNLYMQLDARKIPICVVNGRLTEKTAGSAFRPFLRRAASRLSLVAARDPESAARFRALGAPNVVMCGNLKADLPPPAELHGEWETLRSAWRGSPVLVAGNTVEGEEEIVFAAWQSAKETHPDLRLVIAPRQPKRFGQVAAWLGTAGAKFRTASLALHGDAPGDVQDWRVANVLLLDTMGELASAYGLGHAAIVGGGWRFRGGHNPLEPLRWGVPAILGPHFSNFEDIVLPLLESSPGALRVVEEGDLPGAIVALLAECGRDNKRGHAASAIELPPQLQNALGKTWESLEPFLKGSRQ